MRIKAGVAIGILLGMLFMFPGAAHGGVGLSPDPDGLSGNERGIWIPPAGSVWLAVTKVIRISQNELDFAKKEAARALDTPIAFAKCRAGLSCDGVSVAGDTVCGPLDPTTFNMVPYRVKTVIIPFDGKNGEFHAYGVWDIYNEPQCFDPNHYYIWKFQVAGNAKPGYSLDRLKGRSYSDTYEVSGWTPPADDENYGDPTTISGFVGAKGLGVEGGVGISYRIFPGHRHGYMGTHIYHNSWISNSQFGSQCCPSIETDGANEWKMTATDNGLKGTARIEVWFHTCKPNYQGGCSV